MQDYIIPTPWSCGKTHFCFLNSRNLQWSIEKIFSSRKGEWVVNILWNMTKLCSQDKQHGHVVRASPHCDSPLQNIPPKCGITTCKHSCPVVLGECPTGIRESSHPKQWKRQTRPKMPPLLLELASFIIWRAHTTMANTMKSWSIINYVSVKLTWTKACGIMFPGDAECNFLIANPPTS